VHDMMDDIAEQQDVAREISDAISNPVAFGQDIDEVITFFIGGCH
jgi:charged multivesicular body protein 4A/B